MDGVGLVFVGPDARADRLTYQPSADRLPNGAARPHADRLTYQPSADRLPNSAARPHADAAPNDGNTDTRANDGNTDVGP